MTRQEVRARIEENLQNADLSAEEVRIQPGFYGGWRIAVVAEGFEGKSPTDRNRLALSGLEGEELEWLDLVTPAEREWAGALPADIEEGQLPLWPEALGRREDSPVVFASDRDEDLPPPVVVTF